MKSSRSAGTTKLRAANIYNKREISTHAYMQVRAKLCEPGVIYAEVMSVDVNLRLMKEP